MHYKCKIKQKAQLSMKQYKGKLCSQAVKDNGKKMQKRVQYHIAFGNKKNQKWHINRQKLITQGVEIHTCKIQAIEDNYPRTYLSQLYFYLKIETIQQLKYQSLLDGS